MADHPTLKLIKRLRDRTVDGRLKWEETEGANVFQTAFPEHSVQVSQEFGGDLALRIFDSDGDLVDIIYGIEISSTFGSSFGDLLQDIFVNARRSAKGIDRAVQSLLEALGDDDDD